MEWKEVLLSEFLEFNPKRTIKKNEVARKITMDLLIPHSKQIYNFKYEPYTGGAKFSNGDTIMARITPCLENGKHAYVSCLNEGEIAYGSTEYIVLCGKNGVSDNEFVYYLSHTPQFVNTAIKSMVGSSGRQRAQVPVLENLIMPVPVNLSDQRKIAGILSALDSKIENNNKINANLEAQAEALFKSWFVDFTPFKDQPFVDSELGPIPQGWKVGKLGDIGEIVGGSTPSKSKPEYYTTHGIAWLTPKDLSTSKAKFTSRGEIDITDEGYKSTSTKLMPRGSVLFSSRAPIGYLTIAKNEICTNQGFKSLVPNGAGTGFIYYTLRHLTPQIENRATGSTFKEASATLMRSVETIVPPTSILNKFEELLRPILQFQEKKEEENQRLAALRDTLLPKLMSGEIKL